MPENARGQRSKPRASSIGKCLRQNAYMMTDTPRTDEQSDESTYTQEQGRVMEDLSIAALERGTQGRVQVGHRQLCIGHVKCSEQHEQGPEAFPLTGHIDGQLAPTDGFEHKNLGRYGYEGLFKEYVYTGAWNTAVEGEAPVYLCQSLTYGMALGWDRSLFVVVAQDASSTRSDATRNRKIKDASKIWANHPDWNPKAFIFWLELADYKVFLWPMIRNRAGWLTKWKARPDADPDQVQREYDPEKELFPCTYCPWYTRCKEVGQQGLRGPGLPFSENRKAAQ